MVKKKGEREGASIQEGRAGYEAILTSSQDDMLQRKNPSVKAFS
jgi:hypothetical protein